MPSPTVLPLKKKKCSDLIKQLTCTCFAQLDFNVAVNSHFQISAITLVKLNSKNYIKTRASINGFSFNLLIIISVNQLVVWSIKCQSTVINVSQCFPKSKMMFSDVVFSPQAKVIQFKVIEQKTNQKIFTLKKLE